MSGLENGYPVLVLGGYGTFGGRISRLLARNPDLHIHVVGRSLPKAEGLANRIRTETPAAHVNPLAMDIRTDLAGCLRRAGAGLVVHAAGPFQGQDYAVAQCCIDHGVHYLDIADSRDFVCGFDRLDGKARAKRVTAISGASSVPGLTSAVVENLRLAFGAVSEIHMALVPDTGATMGRAMVDAILSYAGTPIPRWRDGGWTEVFGWQDLAKHRTGGVGGPSIGPCWTAACDVPDSVLLPQTVPELQTVTFRAGHQSRVVHFGLWALSWLVRAGIVPSLQRYAPLLRRAVALAAPFASGRGGMSVELRGVAPDGRPLIRRWAIVAGSGDGPWIPCLPAAILANAIVRGDLTRRGAMPCRGLFGLDDFESAIRPFDIRMGEIEDERAPVFARLAPVAA